MLAEIFFLQVENRIRIAAPPPATSPDPRFVPVAKAAK